MRCVRRSNDECATSTPATEHVNRYDLTLLLTTTFSLPQKCTATWIERTQQRKMEPHTKVLLFFRCMYWCVYTVRMNVVDLSFVS